MMMLPPPVTMMGGLPNFSPVIAAPQVGGSLSSGGVASSSATARGRRSRSASSGAGSDASGSAATSSTSSSDSVARRRARLYDTSMETRVTSSATFISTLPRARRTQLLECIDKRLDAALLSDVPSEVVNKFLWLVTRVKPNTRVSELRVRRYKDLAALFRRAAARIRQSRSEAGRDDDIIAAVCASEQHASEIINAAAAAAGWQDEFASTKKQRGGPRDQGRASLHPQGQQQQSDGEDGTMGQRSMHEYLRSLQQARAEQRQPAAEPQVAAAARPQPQPQAAPPGSTQESRGERARATPGPEPAQPPAPAAARTQEPERFALVLDMMSQCYKLYNRTDGTWSWCSRQGELCELTEVDGQSYLRFPATGLPA